LKSSNVILNQNRIVYKFPVLNIHFTSPSLSIIASKESKKAYQAVRFR